MAYLTVFTAFNISAQGVTPDGKKAVGTYSLDCIKGNIRVKFNKEIYATSNGRKCTFIPANTYVNLAKNGLQPSQYIYSARTTTNASTVSFPNITGIKYSVNIQDVINNPTITGTTNAGTGMTATIRLSATTNSTIAVSTRVNPINLDTGHTRYYEFKLNTSKTNLSGYKIMELRHMNVNSGGTYIYCNELYNMLGTTIQTIKYYTPYSGNTFMVNRMTNDIKSYVCTFNPTTMFGGADITGLYNTNPNGKILTSDLLTKIYPYAFDCESVDFDYGLDTNGGLVFTVGKQYSGIDDIFGGMPDSQNERSPSIFSGFTKGEIAGGSLDYAVRCDEFLSMGAVSESISPIGNVVHTYGAYLAINDSDKTITLQGNVGAVVKIPFVSGIDNTFKLTWSGSTSKVDNAYLYNGAIYIVANSLNVDETGYLKITAKGANSSVASVTIKLLADKQSCYDCDNCNDSSSCQYT